METTYKIMRGDELLDTAATQAEAVRVADYWRRKYREDIRVQVEHKKKARM